MDAQKISDQLRQAYRHSGLTIWEVARRAELQVPDVARALGHRAALPPLDVVEAVGHALGLELVFVEAKAHHMVSMPRTLVDQAVARVGPDSLAYPSEGGIKVLALDLEATLISDAVSAVPRPGLYEFLEAAHGLFERVVLFTALAEPKFRELALALQQKSLVPPWFVAIECVRWSGPTKDLDSIFHVTAGQVLLVDDSAQMVHTGQEGQWVETRGFAPPFDEDDDELSRVLEVLVDRVVGLKSTGGGAAVSGVEAVEAFIAGQRGLLDRLEAFARTPGFERLCATLRRGGAEGSEAWLATWLIQPAWGLGKVPLEVIDEPDGLVRINEHLLRVLINPNGA